MTAFQLDPIHRQIEVRYDLASHVQATMIMVLLQGLRSFLMVAVSRKDLIVLRASLKSRDRTFGLFVGQGVNLG